MGWTLTNFVWWSIILFYSPLALWFTFTWAISEIHKINFSQGKECFSLKRTYNGFHCGGYGFLLCVKTAKRNKSIHNFLCLLWNKSQQSISQFFVALCEQFYDGIQKVYQRPFLDVQLLSLLWSITSHSHISTFFAWWCWFLPLKAPVFWLKVQCQARVLWQLWDNSSPDDRTLLPQTHLLTICFKPLILASNVSLETQYWQFCRSPPCFYLVEMRMCRCFCYMQDEKITIFTDRSLRWMGNNKRKK